MLNMTSWIAMAPTAGGGGTGGGGAMGGPGMIVWMVLMVGIFYIMIIRPQQRKEKERRKLLEQIKTGDRVVFSGGILGTITNVKDKTYLIKVADNVKVEVLRGAVSHAIEKGELPDEKDASATSTSEK